MNLSLDTWRTQGVPQAITSSRYQEITRQWGEPARVIRAERVRLPLDRDEMLRRKRTNHLRIFFRQGATKMMTTEQIDAAIAAAGIDVTRAYGAQELGKLLNLTVAEYLRFKVITGCFPSSFTPADRTRRQAKAIRDEFNRPARTAAEHQRRVALAADKAGRVQTVADLDCRASAIHTILDVDRWKTALQLSKLLKHSPAFQPLAGRSLKWAVQRVLGKLVASGRVETKRERSRNGLPMDLFRRR
jgi:hypothetical protein